jgi:very-short-patch-repair endonuclease
MTGPHRNPSPLAGEGAERQSREAGEGVVVSRARQLRRTMTDAERKLWFAVRDRRFEHVKFRRQVPVGPYIADFLCHAHRLVVEVDGGQHGSACDAARDQWFVRNGFRVLRFWNNDVLTNTAGVLAAIIEAVTPHPATRESASPLSRKGRG